MTATTLFATTNRSEADQYISDAKGLKQNVIEIKSADVLELWKANIAVDTWYSGPDQEWILVIATPEKITTPAAP
jgi:hypothetical protein